MDAYVLVTGRLEPRHDFDYGSGVRPDIFYIIYWANLKPQSEELGGLADGLQWADAARLVYTRTDSHRENCTFFGLACGGSFRSFSTTALPAGNCS